MPRTPSRTLHLCAIALALLVSLFAARPARAAQDYVQFGTSVHVEKGTTAHDVVCFFCSAHIEGEVNGDVVVFFGNVDIDGQAHHDVVNFFGSTRAGNDASMDKDVVNFFGSVRLGDHASIGHDLVVMFGGFHAAESASVGGSRVIQPGWIFWLPLLLIVAGISVFFREMNLRRHRLRMLRGY